MYNKFLRKNMRAITNEILELLNKGYNDPAKKAFRHIPEITYGNLLERILEDRGMSPLSIVFPELSRVTCSKLLSEIFPEKEPREHWFTFLLSLVSKKQCCNCKKLKLPAEFHKNILKSDGRESACTECRSITRNIAYIDNREKELAQCKKYKKENYTLIKEKDRAYYNTHKKEAFARSAKRRASKLHATPSWTDLKEVTTIYTNCPEGHHVDHIIPLQAEDICGLHVEHNLQYLLAKDNLSKGNRFDCSTYVHIIEYIAPYAS
jgi:hypothetical protein